MKLPLVNIYLGNPRKLYFYLRELFSCNLFEMPYWHIEIYDTTIYILFACFILVWSLVCRQYGLT
jgi:hypothetical protein